MAAEKVKWERAGKYAIRSGNWVIAKYIVDGKPVYGATFKNERRGFFDDVNQAKKTAALDAEKEAA